MNYYVGNEEVGQHKIVLQFYYDQFAALQNRTVLLHNVSVNVMLNSPNLLHQFSKFVVPPLPSVQREPRPMVIHLEQNCDNAFAILTS